jgi:hypothetical protein
MILSGLIAVALTFMLANSAIADTPPYEGGPGPHDPQIYFLKKAFDFCNDGTYVVGEADFEGGSVPDGFDVQNAGCVDYWSEWGDFGYEQMRNDNYAFTGEQIGELVVVRDIDGAEDIVSAYLYVDGEKAVKCRQLNHHDVEDIMEDGWKGHDVCSGLLCNEIPPQKNEITEPGYDERFDKVYECVLTVTDEMQDETEITVTAMDESEGEDTTPVQLFLMNPEVSLDIGGYPIEFEDGAAGETVYSQNADSYLTITNVGSGAIAGVDIAVWLGGTDLSASLGEGARCPTSNILDVEEYMDFKCVLDNGIYIEQCWQDVENKDVKQGCLNVNSGEGKRETCLGLNPLFANDCTCGPGVGHDNILRSGHEATCEFRLEYPVPCIGTFENGNLIVLMRAI